MRTRIALVAAIPVALITVSTLTQSADAQAVRTTTHPPDKSIRAPVIAMPPNESVAYRGLLSSAPAFVGVSLPFTRRTTPDVRRVVTTAGSPTPDTAAINALPKASAPVAPPPAPAPTAPVDTVTPDQRAAWERVAMCEEGGDWQSDGSTFSGGLGVSRANWDAYGGLEFAPEGAEATEDQQIMVAERIQASPPDQGGCRGW